MLRVKVHGLDGEPLDLDNDEVDFISFVNASTFGKPAIIAPGDDHQRGNVKVLYVFPGGISALEVEKA